MASTHPLYEHDVFAPDALRQPFDHLSAIRDLAPVVALGSSGLLAMGRFADVQRALRSPDILVSGQGVGLNDIFNTLPPSILASDGEAHRHFRSNVSRPLTPAALKEHRAELKRMIEQQVLALCDTGWFDGVEKLAQFLPLNAISQLVGLPEAARLKMLHWATVNFDLQQPLTSRLIEESRTLFDAILYLSSLERDDVRPGSWADQMFEAVASGKLSRESLLGALGALTLPSLDTTIHSKSGMLYYLGTDATAWSALKADPSLIPSAVLESVRLSSVVRWFTRVAISDYRAGDALVPAGTRVVILYGSANRDERHYPDANSFDIRRNPVDHLGWGTGPHMCVGMHLAKLEMEVLLEAMVENCTEIEAEDAVPSANGGLYGFESLRMRLVSR